MKKKEVIKTVLEQLKAHMSQKDSVPTHYLVDAMKLCEEALK